jgi:RNA polymerase subunit RPABC4/transcription elongation factor Spt4
MVAKAKPEYVANRYRQCPVSSDVMRNRNWSGVNVVIGSRCGHTFMTVARKLAGVLPCSGPMM